jgi:hypothetical protein
VSAGFLRVASEELKRLKTSVMLSVRAVCGDDVVLGI